MTSITIDVDDVLKVGDRLGAVTGARLNAALVRAVNEVTTRFDSSARKAMNAGIDLPDAYISSRMSVEMAVATPQATITAAGPGRAGRQGLTTLGRYNPKTLTGSLARPGGVTVEVTRGSPKTLTRRTFLMRLKQGTAAGDQFGVFERTGKDGAKRAWKHLYGVSPYSLFRFQRDTQEGAVHDDLATTALAAVAAEVRL